MAHNQENLELIHAECYEGGYTAVKDAVREPKHTTGEVCVPLIHRTGEAQLEFGQGVVKLRKVMFFAMIQRFSDTTFIVANECECAETFQDGNVRAILFFGGVPTRVSYDNANTSVSRITVTYAHKHRRHSAIAEPSSVL